MRVHFEALEEPWQEVSRPALIGWLVFFGLVLLLAATDDDGFLFIDNANLLVHEAGHLLFSYLGGWRCGAEPSSSFSSPPRWP